MSRTTQNIIEIGRDLIETKRKVGRGNFLPWIEAYFGMSEMSATHFLDVAGTFKLNRILDLPATVLYALPPPQPAICRASHRPGNPLPPGGTPCSTPLPSRSGPALH